MKLADVAAAFCKLSYSWAWVGERGRAAKMGTMVLILPGGEGAALLGKAICICDVDEIL